MFRHIVLLSLVDDATDADADGILAALAGMPERIPGIRSFVVGTDAGLADGNADICVVADFDDAAAYEVYRDHPAHQEVIATHIRPVLAQRHAIQFGF